MEDEDSVPLVPKTRDKSQHLHKVQCPGLSGPRIHSHPAGAHTGDANTEGTRADLLYSCCHVVIAALSVEFTMDHRRLVSRLR